MCNQCEGRRGRETVMGDICQALLREREEETLNVMVSKTSESHLEDARRMYRNSEFWERVLIIGATVVILILLMIYFLWK